MDGWAQWIEKGLLPQAFCHYSFCMSFPQYRISCERLKEEWASRVAWNRLHKRRLTAPPSQITDNSEPWIRNPSSVAEYLEIARKVHQTTARWKPQQKNSSPD